MKRMFTCMMFLTLIATGTVLCADEKVGTSGWSYCPYCGTYWAPQTEYGRGQGLSGARGMMDSGIGPVNKENWFDYKKDRVMIRQSEACQEFLDNTVELRKELNDKRFVYHEAIRDPEAKPEDIMILEKDLTDLQEKISSKRPLECIW